MERQLKPFPMPPEESEEQGTEVPISPEQPKETTFAQHAATYQQPKKKSNHWLIILVSVVIVVLLGAGAGGYYWWHKQQKPAATKRQASTSTQPAPSATTSSDIAQYVSTGKDLNLSFSYPSDWTAKPTSGDNASDQTITLTSPLVSIPDASDGTATGKVVVQLRPASADLSELSPGTATVAQDSVQFAYTKPTSSQHQYPYLTFIHLEAGSNASNTFDEVIITGISKFTKSQSITAGSLGQLDPVISATFYKCLSQACEGSSAKTLTITNGTWQDTDVFKQVQALFQSLQLN